MFCKNCGQPMDNLASVCVHCGVAAGVGNKFCPNCGTPTPGPAATFCTNCGVAFIQPVNSAMQKSKLVAGILGILLGGLGIHNFYLGFNKRGLIQLLVSIFTCGIGAVPMQIWGFIEGIFYLTGHYNVDANGIPLKD